MEGFRYFLGVLTLLIVPPGLMYWLVIHGWARRWRKWGPKRTYLTVLPVLSAFGVLLYQVREQALGVNLGTNRITIGAALVLCLPMIWLELQYWRHLSFSTLVGLPELSQQPKSKLMREGIYGVVRHPRYLSAGIGLVVNALFANYLGLYFLLIAAIPPGLWMLALEERELLERFGDAYREYQRDVPQLIPRLRGGG